MKLSKEIILKKLDFRTCKLSKFGLLLPIRYTLSVWFFMSYPTATLKQPMPKKTATFTPCICNVCKVIP